MSKPAATDAPVATETTATPAAAEATPVAAAPAAKVNSKREKLLSTLSADERTAVVGTPKPQVASDASKAHNPGAAGSTPAPATKPDAKADAGELVVTFGDAPGDKPTPAADGDPELPALTPEQLAALGDDARKRLGELDKANLRLRKRAQEGETKLSEAEKRLAEMEARLKRAEEVTAASRSQGLAGNTFGEWNDEKQVSAWERAGKEMLAKFHELSIAHASGQEPTEDMLTYKLPSGEEQKLDLDSYEAAQLWVKDAEAWRSHRQAVNKYRDQAKPVVERHASLDGYTDAHNAYLNDPHLSARTEEMAAKAALYDLIQSKGGKIIFPGKAGAANSASASPTTEAQKSVVKPTPTPPSETPASTPRMAPAGTAATVERSALMERAMKSGSDEDIRAALLARKQRA